VKLRDLDRRSGGAEFWAPRWIESPPPSDASEAAEDGVLEGVARLGNRLLLRVNVSGCGRTASLEWETPPAVSDVEAILLASIGVQLRDLGDLELPTRTGLEPATPSSRGRARA
jgi:hypothetical protein